MRPKSACQGARRILCCAKGEDNCMKIAIGFSSRSFVEYITTTVPS